MSAHDYGLADRLLHKLALGVPTLTELSFDLDQKASGVVLSAPEVARLPHVFVTGLARAGTTIILRHLHATGHFRSLTYRDMPFALAPNLWKRLSGRWQQRQRLRARAHGDGIHVNADSPEALEEIFWRVQSGPDYIERTGLSPYEPDEETLVLFQRYVAAILASAQGGQWRYLSKNNNNILRLPALSRTFSESLFVIPFRDPLVQASSLLHQHHHFCSMQKDSPFVRSYMNWLVHHEFGLGHRPFLFGCGPAWGLTPDMPDYWLDMWIRTYRHLLAQADDRHLFICYEDLCTQPSVWSGLLDRLRLPAGNSRQFRQQGQRRPDLFSHARMAEAEAIYGRLREQAHRNQSVSA